MATLEDALTTATTYHQAGKLVEAEHIYRQILAVEPEHPQTLHMLGVLAIQHRQFEAAVDLITRAIRRDRGQATFYGNLAEAYRHLNRIDEALDSYQRALKLQPSLIQVLLMQGIVLRNAGRTAEATESLRGVIRAKPDDVEARMVLGQILLEEHKPAEAEAVFRRVVRIDPKLPEAQFNLGNALQDQNKLRESLDHFRAALNSNPNHVEAHNNLAAALKQLDQLGEALEHCVAAIKLDPKCVAAHTNLGGVLVAQGEFDQAIEAYRTALAVDPATTLARHNLGTALQSKGRLDEARQCFEEVLRVEPDNQLSHLALGHVLLTQGNLPAAIAQCQTVLRIDPTSADAYVNMAVAWSDQGKHDEAIACSRRAIELKPGSTHAHGNLAISLQSQGRLEEALAEHRRAVECDPLNAGMHSNLLYLLNYLPHSDAQTIFAEHRVWGQRHADPLTAVSTPHTNDRTAGRGLKIGYVSPHFLAHAVNFFSYPILASHDHAQFEVFCYSDVVKPDETTAHLQSMADVWRNVAGATDAQVAEMVRNDQIDILVDLTGHIAGGKRALVFARKPAPIQVTYIGYQNTTGMLAMDYRLTDEYSDPTGTTEPLHTEKLIRLPTTFFCYLPSTDAPEVGELPASSNGFVTFCSVNNFTKITHEVLAVWAQILLRVPKSRLMLRADMTDSLRQEITAQFASLGVEANRLLLANRAPRKEYLQLIAGCDIALDPFPFNGHTTTCDCLWQGVPVVTLSGKTYVSRFGGSGLMTLGLSELIAHTPEEYIELAVKLAGDHERLRVFRSTLRRRMADSPLLEFQAFTRNLEAEYRRMWTTWLSQQG